MPIRNDDELAAVADEVGRKLQDIQNYLGAGSHRSAKVRFPRGYIRTAEHFRSKLRFIDDSNARDNIAYALILTDVYRWITTRTDLFGTAREMVIKSGVILAGSICETMAVKYTDGLIGRSVRFKARCTRMAGSGLIAELLRDELHWLWDARAAIHICDVDIREYERYSTADYSRAICCVRDLRDKLDAHAIATCAREQRIESDTHWRLSGCYRKPKTTIGGSARNLNITAWALPPAALRKGELPWGKASSDSARRRLRINTGGVATFRGARANRSAKASRWMERGASARAFAKTQAFRAQRGEIADAKGEFCFDSPISGRF